MGVSAAYQCLVGRDLLGKRRNDSLSRKTGTRRYRTVCWVSTEGFTEKDYFSMDVFRDVDVALKFPKDIHPDRRKPYSSIEAFSEGASHGGLS